MDHFSDFSSVAEGMASKFSGMTVVDPEEDEEEEHVSQSYLPLMALNV